MEEGRFYLFAVPFFWTFVGRFVRQLNFQTFEIADAIYFTRTGATFDILCSEGLRPESKWHGPFPVLFIDAQGPKFPWHAPTPWAGRDQKPARREN